MSNKEGRGFNYFVTQVIEIVVNLELAYMQKIRNKILARVKSIVGSSTTASQTVLITGDCVKMA